MLHERQLWRHLAGVFALVDVVSVLVLGLP
jgi:hypothetical protein